MYTPPRPRLLPLIPSVAALMLGACDLGTLYNPLPPPTLESIVVSPSGSEVQVGDTIRLNAIGKLSGLLGALSYSPLDGAAWAVSDPAVAVVEPLPTRPPTDSTRRAEALVRGVQPGTVRVTVSALGLEGSTEVRVVPALAASTVRPGAARVAGIPTSERP